MKGNLVREETLPDGRIPFSLTGTWHVIFDYHNIGPFGSQHVYNGPASTDPASEEDHTVFANPQILYDPVSNTFSGQIIAQYRTTRGAEPLVQFVAPIGPQVGAAPLSGKATVNEVTASWTFVPNSECPEIGQRTPVTLNPITTNRISIKPWQIHYGELDLQFTSDPPVLDGSFCLLSSNVGSLPVILTYPNMIPESGFTLAFSTGTTTLNYFQNNFVQGVPSCDFRPGFEVNNECFLTETRSLSPNNIIARWNTPGFEIKRTGEFVDFVYNTGPKTFYASFDDMTNLGLNRNNGFIPEGLENYFHSTISINLPDISKVAVFQDPPANDILVTDLNGHEVGKISTGEEVAKIPGSHYITLDDVSAVVLQEPPEGRYNVEVKGVSSGPFDLSMSSVSHR